MSDCVISENPIIVPQSQAKDYVYISIERANLTLENFSIDYDDHYFADSQLRLDGRMNGKVFEYAIEINYRCREYGGAMINYELELNIPDCGTANIYWKKLCGNPITTRDGFTVEMMYKNYKQQIISNGMVNNATYFDADLENYVVNIPRDVDKLKFLVYMKNANPPSEPVAEGFITDEQTLRSLPAVNLSIPFVDSDESIAKAWFTGPLAEGGLVETEEKELELNFKCLKFGTSKIEMTIPFDYFKDISLVFVKDCTYGNRMQNVIKAKYEEGDRSSSYHLNSSHFPLHGAVFHNLGTPHQSLLRQEERPGQHPMFPHYCQPVPLPDLSGQNVFNDLTLVVSVSLSDPSLKSTPILTTIRTSRSSHFTEVRNCCMALFEYN